MYDAIQLVFSQKKSIFHSGRKVLFFVLQGHSCDTKKDLCADGLFTCQHGGTCRTWQYNSDSDKIEPAVCDCAPGWSGDHCQTEIDECASHPCQHDARWVN